MNLVIRGMDFNLGKGGAFQRNQHPDLRADYVLANPPFNVSDWWNEKLEGDPLGIRYAAERGQLRLVAAHPISPQTQWQSGRSAGERLYVFIAKQRRRDSPGDDRS